MYVTAQHVENEHGEAGVHVFVFVHGPSLAGVDWVVPDAGFIADQHPGELLLAMRQVSGDRIAVLSYLDVAFHRSLATDAGLLLRRLVARKPESAAWPVKWSQEGIAARFYVVASRRDNADAEWVDLQNALLPVLGHAVPMTTRLPAGTTPTTRPVVVTKEHTSRAYQYRLDDTSRRQLEALGVPLLPQSVISVSLENYDAFEAITGRDFEAEVVPFLSKIPLSNLEALGGAEVRDAATGAPLWVSEGLLRRRSQARR